MPSSTLISFSKINIGLKITSKRNDGFHDLETIFYPVDLHDTIDITIEPGHLKINSITIDSDDKVLPNDITNLCYRAVQNFFSEFPQSENYNIEIFIHKNIPIGGGLAGGSSNAAAVIKYLAENFGINVNENWDRLIKVALETGSDVPFFLYGKPCFASGRGEKMIPLDDFVLDYDILLVNPNIHVSTKDAFDALNVKPGDVRESSLSEVKTFDPSRADIFENDFEKVVFPKHPEIADIKNEMLNGGAVFASMSGSGATVYGLFAPPKNSIDNSKLDMLKEKFSALGYFTYVSSLKNSQ